MGFFFCIVGIDRGKSVEMLSALRAGFSKLKAPEHVFDTDSGAKLVDGWSDFFISWKWKQQADLMRGTSAKELNIIIYHRGVTKEVKMRDANSKGFTITELIITVAIIGILAAIVIPMYTNHIRRARRSDAKVALENVRAMAEQFRSENGTWPTSLPNEETPQDLVSLGWPNNDGAAALYDAGDYRISYNDGHGSGFIATAEPRAGTRQYNTDDQEDGWLAIDAEGNKTSGGAVDRWK